MELAVASGYSPGKIPKIKSLEPYISEEYFRDTLDKKWGNWYLNHADQNAIKIITRLYISDQYVRKNVYKPNKKEEWAMHQLSLVDSLGLNELMTYINAEGFPDRFEIGESAHQMLYVLLLHQLTDLGTSEFSFYNKLLKSQLDVGNLDPEQYASIVDRHLSWGHNMPVRYGMYAIGIDGEFTNFERIDSLDYRRRRIGLSPYAFVEESNDRKLPPNYLPSESFRIKASCIQ